MPERAPTKKTDPHVWAVTGAILAHWYARNPGATIKALAKAAGSRSSTWHGWRNGTRRPTFLELSAYARAAGMDLLAVGEGAPTKNGAAGDLRMTGLTRQMVAVMESLSEDGRRDLLDMALSYRRTVGVPSNPQMPASSVERHAPTSSRQK